MLKFIGFSSLVFFFFCYLVYAKHPTTLQKCEGNKYILSLRANDNKKNCHSSQKSIKQIQCRATETSKRIEVGSRA